MVSVHAYQVTVYFRWRGTRREAEHARAPCNKNQMYFAKQTMCKLHVNNVCFTKTYI